MPDRGEHGAGHRDQHVRCHRYRFPQDIEGIRGTNFADPYDATGFDGFSTNAGSLGNYNEFEGPGRHDTINGNGNTAIVYGSATEV